MTEIGSAYVSIIPSARGFGSKLESEVGPGVVASGSSLGSKFGKLFALAGGALIATKIGGFLKDSIAEAREAQVVTARTENVIKSMGLAGQVSANQIADLAMKISNKTAVDDEAIQSGQNLLLTFKNVADSAGQAGGVFEQTSGLMVDMSVAMGTDVKSAALQLGKALNDPIKGVTALTRSGVSFTAQQKEQITRLTESGHLLKAQGIILGEVKKQFGGAGEAMATPGDKARVAFDNLKEQIGTALLPVLDKMLAVFSGQIVPAISTFITQMQSGTGAGGQFASVMTTIGSVIATVAKFIVQNGTAFTILAGVIGTVVAAVKVWTIVQTALNIVLTANPIGLVVVAIAALVAGLVIAYKKSDTFRAVVDAAFTAVKTVVLAVVGWFAQYVPGVFKVVVAVVKTYVNIYKTVITTVFNAVRAVVEAAVGFIGKYVPQVWNTLVGLVKGYVNIYKTAVTVAFDAAKKVIEKVGDALHAVADKTSQFVSAAKDKFTEFVNFMKEIPGKILSAVGDLGHLLYQKGRDLIQGLINGIKDMIPSIPNPGDLIPDIPGLGKVIPGLAAPTALPTSGSGSLIPAGSAGLSELAAMAARSDRGLHIAPASIRSIGREVRSNGGNVQAAMAV